MAQNGREWFNAPIIKLNTTDSTNNDAMRLIDADKALHGTTVVADYQEAGRGQRGKVWKAAAGESLMMSMIIHPEFKIERQFPFAALVAVAIADAIKMLDERLVVKIKWPNDIIVNDRKAGGILIENVLRGSSWLYAVIGLGLNLNQQQFDPELMHATSLHLAGGLFFDRDTAAIAIRNALFDALETRDDPELIMKRYNDRLFRKDQLQVFYTAEKEWTARVCQVLADGRLGVMTDERIAAYYTHGTVSWKY